MNAKRLAPLVIQEDGLGACFFDEDFEAGKISEEECHPAHDTTIFRTDSDQHPGWDAEEVTKDLIKAYNLLPEVVEVLEEWFSLWLHIREHYPNIELPLTLKPNGTDAFGRLRSLLAKLKEAP